MKKYLILISFLFSSILTFGWGQTGHRVVGEIASQHLEKKTRKALFDILGNESLAVASTWMDEIRSDPAYNYMADWHWVTLPEGKTYDETEKNPDGDVISTIERVIRELKENRDSMPLDKQKEYIRILVHLIGDIHQPLHVGTGDDQGGNKVQVVWFWNNNTNLHTVWDSKMIDQKELSYTELAEVIDHPTKSEIEKWQNDSVREWAIESTTYRSTIYDLPDNHKINYVYLFNNWDIVTKRLEQAGIRAAGVLNDIYG